MRETGRIANYEVLPGEVLGPSGASIGVRSGQARAFTAVYAGVAALQHLWTQV